MTAITRTHCANPSALRKILALTLISTLASSSASSPAHSQTAELASASTEAARPVSAGSQAPALDHSADNPQEQLLAQAVEMIRAGHDTDALVGPIAQVIAYYENGKGKDHSTRYYCARSLVETLLYASEAAKNKQTASVLSSTWATAYFMRGNVLINLGKIDDARSALQKALHLSPWNSTFLSEMGYTYIKQRDFDKALQLYESAEAAANFSPNEDTKRTEIGRALRGEGYALAELHRLNDAEAKYHEALRLDPNDQKSKVELEYIKRVRAESGNNQGT